MKVLRVLAVVVTLAKCALMWAVMFAFLCAWRFGLRDSLIASLALMFSSTILVVKLLPTTTLHQKHMGSICIAVLIADWTRCSLRAAAEKLPSSTTVTNARS